MEDLFWSSLQIGLTASLVGVVLLALRAALLRRYPARAMCFVWLALTARLLVPVQLTLPEPPVTVAPRTYQVFSAAPQGEAEAAAPAAVHWKTRAEIARETPGAPQRVVSWGAALGALWLAGAGLCALWYAAAYLLFRRRVRRDARPVTDAALQTGLALERASMGVRRTVALAVWDEAGCPMLTGFFRPVLLLPDPCLSETAARFVFRHELTHWKRGDLWFKLLLTLAGCLHWYNPFVHLLRRAADEDLELACDSAVVRGLDAGARKQYGETILRYAGARRARRRDALLSRFTGDKKTLMKRLQNLFDGKAKKRGAALLLAVALTLGAVGGSFAIGQDAAAAQAAPAARLEQMARDSAQAWAAAYRDGDGRALYELLTPDKARTLLQAFAAESESGDPEQIQWRFGTSSPSIDGYQVLSADPAGGLTADIVFQWRVSGAPKTRTLTRLTFARDGERLRVAKVEGDCGGTPGAVRDGDYPADLNTLAGFEKRWANDLGLRLPEVTLYDEEALAAYRAQYGADLTDPAEAAASLLALEGGRVAGTEACTAWGKPVGAYVDYVWPDGGVRVLMLRQYDDSGYVPVDWTYLDAGARTGTNTRTDRDLAYQWATAMVEECGMYQWALLPEAKRPDYWDTLINKDDEGWWSWRIGYGSSPDTSAFTLVPREDGSIHVVYRLYDSGIPFYRMCETLRFGSEGGRRTVTETSGLAGEFGNYIDNAAEFLALYDNDLPPTFGVLGNERLETYQETGDEWIEDPEQVARNFYQLSDTGAFESAANGERVTVSYAFPRGGGTLHITLAHSEKAYPKAWLPEGWTITGEYGTVFQPLPDYGPPSAAFTLADSKTLLLTYSGNADHCQVLFTDGAGKQTPLAELPLTHTAEARTERVALADAPAASGSITVRVWNDKGEGVIPFPQPYGD